MNNYKITLNYIDIIHLKAKNIEEVLELFKTNFCPNCYDIDDITSIEQVK